MKEELLRIQVDADFAYHTNQYDGSITIYQKGKEINLSHWEALLLYSILKRDLEIK